MSDQDVMALTQGYLAVFPSLPQANAQNRGRIAILYGAAGAVDQIKVCRKKADDTYEWYDVTQIPDLGVTTAKLADGSVTSAKVASGAVVSNLGYTPINKAGDSGIGALDLGSNKLTCGGVTLKAGVQETGAVSARFYAHAGWDYFDVGVNFKATMTNVPSSITIGGGASTNLLSGFPQANSIGRYGFRFEISANAAGDAYYLGGTYTTVGN